MANHRMYSMEGYLFSPMNRMKPKAMLLMITIAVLTKIASGVKYGDLEASGVFT